MRTQRNEHGFTALEVILVIAILFVIAVAGYFALKNVSSHQAALSPSATATPPVSPSVLKAASFSDEGLSLKYPSDWAASTDATTKGLLLTKRSGSASYIIRLEYATGDYKANAAASAGMTPVSKFTFDGKAAYIVNDELGGNYQVSSCPAPSLCIFPAKHQSQYGINEYLEYIGTPSQQDEVAYPTDAESKAILAEAATIMASLSY